MDPKSTASLLFASMYVCVNKLSHYYGETKPAAKKCAKESVENSISVLTATNTNGQNKELIAFYKKVDLHLDEM